MLRELHVRNFALIEKVDIEFDSGLSLLTGETGAGKSILVDALGLALGERSSGADQVRSGAERASVDALFDLADAPPSCRARIEEYGIECDDGSLIVSREITIAGKSACRANGRLVPLSALREIADYLIDVHGQHEHQSLLSPARHLLLLDEWIGGAALSLRSQVGAEHATLSSLKSDLETLRAEARERERNLDLYRYQVDDIESARLQPGEEAELAAARSRLANSERLAAAAQEAYAALSEAGLDALNSALASVTRAAHLDPGLEEACDPLTEAVAYAEDARKALRRYREGLEADPERLEEIENRLSLLSGLMRKYGESVEEVLAFGAKLTDKITVLENQSAHESDLAELIAQSEARLGVLAGNLTKLRADASHKFAGDVQEQVSQLGMAAARFEVRLEPAQVSPRGADDVEFLISTNPGEPLKPLIKVASGGELSRLMLAMKSVLSSAAFMPTLIFDEIDVGVGGRTAAVIADKLHALAKSAQVICITHLPQIASRPASAHYFIDKKIDNGRTVIEVCRLSDSARVDEIVRMMGGSRGSETAERHAREMLDIGAKNRNELPPLNV